MAIVEIILTTRNSTACVPVRHDRVHPDPDLRRRCLVAGTAKELGTRWRLLSSGQRAFDGAGHLRKGETYRDLAVGFGVGTTTAYRYLREALQVLAALAPTLAEAIAVATRKATG